MTQYFRPQTLADAMQIRTKHAVTVLAGGTDVYPAKAQSDAWSGSADTHILDITKLDDCRGISDQGDHYRIGALTTWTDLLRADLPHYFDGCKQAAREIGGLQIQNRGTLAGNLCNASPAADGVPVLLTLDARVELASQQGQRSLPLENFITDYRQTACRNDELLTAITIPKQSETSVSRFLKLGTRRYLVISLVMVAAVAEIDDADRLTDLRIAIGACSPVARRLRDLESRLIGNSLSRDLAMAVTNDDLKVLAPIDDCRASGPYRNHAALILTRRLLIELGTLVAEQNSHG